MGNKENSNNSNNTSNNSDNDNKSNLSISNSIYDSKVNINENQNNSEHNQNNNIQSNSYSLLSTDNNLDNKSNKAYNNRKKKTKKFNKKRKNKKAEKNYYNNTCKKKSIIGICLNLLFWIWSILLILDHSQIIKFPRSSSGKKLNIMFVGANNDSFLGSFLSTLIFTIFNYIIGFLYPEILFIIFYSVYIIYSILNISSEIFKNNCLLSYNMYIFLVILTMGEIYKLFARKYLDI